VVFFADPRHLPSGQLPVVTLTSFRASFVVAVCAVWALVLTPSEARAQSDISGCSFAHASHLIAVAHDSNHHTLQGTVEHPVQIDCDDVQLFADSMELYRTEGRMTAQGHVTFVSGTSRITAERMEFNTKTKTGTFYVASGTSIMKQGTPADAGGGQEPYAYFWGDELHKIGPKKYRIVRGGFTACVQPTPRWEVSAGSLTLEMDDHVVLTSAVFRVKGVPLLYLPLFYYPMEEDNRSTGFLMPKYGTWQSTGQQITNGFFWAIGRSHDLTLSHDWFTKTGYRLGGEYRYELGGGSSGAAQFYRLSEKPTETTVGGVTTTTQGEQSYRLSGSLVQRLAAGLRARANADYFSSLRTQQRYEQNFFQATNRRRNFGGNVTGNWGGFVMSGTLEQRDTFVTPTRFLRDGTLPRVTLSKGESPIGGAPIYFGANAEYVTVVRKTVDAGVDGDDRGLTRYNVNPTIRVPFTKWPFLTFNSSASWRGTYWTESLDTAKTQVPEALSRSFFTVESRITGPVFNRIWNPNSSYADKVKHVVEPTFTIRRTTNIEQFDRIVIVDGTDSIKGTTEYSWGLANRFYVKKGVSREILNIDIHQSYYTDQTAVQYDPNYQSSYNPTASKFTPVAILARFAPTNTVQANLRTEWDASKKAIRTIAANGSYNADWITGSAGWSQQRAIEDLPGFTEENATHYFNSTTTVHTRRNSLGGTVSFHYDVKNSHFIDRGLMAYYNAQCCGVSVQYQSFFLRGSAAGIDSDKRFNISFTLAGIGAVPNFFGGLSGQNRR
jgi:LPS-assembly protein